MLFFDGAVCPARAAPGKLPLVTLIFLFEKTMIGEGGKRLTLYLDNCCYNRPYDDQTQDRIHIESEAVLAVLRACESGYVTILSSPVVRMEIDKFSNEDKRTKVLSLYSLAEPDIPFTDEIKKRAEELRSKSSIRLMDSLHVATAEAGNVDAMLTTDDKLIKACARLELKVRVMNPVYFVLEILKGGEK